MITQLTADQESKIKEYYEKYLAMGKDCNNIPDMEAQAIVEGFYHELGYKKPTVLFMDSPFGNLIILNSLQNIGQNISQNISQNIRQNIRQNICQNIWQNIRQNIWQNIEQNIWRNIRQNIGQNIEQNIEQNIWRNIRQNIGQNIEQNIGSFWHGQHNSNWVSYYLYFSNVFGFKSQNIKLYKELENTLKIHWFNVFENTVVISRKPEYVKLKENQLHCDGGPCIKYKDGYSIWALNGVMVSQEIAETSRSKLSSGLILKEQNAEVRRELVRKIGIEKVCSQLGAVIIDKKDDYELLSLNLGDGRVRPYLKMKNPSIGVYHIEGVSPECRTVEQALNFRCGHLFKDGWHPEILT